MVGGGVPRRPAPSRTWAQAEVPVATQRFAPRPWLSGSAQLRVPLAGGFTAQERVGGEVGGRAGEGGGKKDINKY